MSSIVRNKKGEVEGRQRADTLQSYMNMQQNNIPFFVLAHVKLNYLSIHSLFRQIRFSLAEVRWIGALCHFSTMFGYIWRSVSTAGGTDCSWEWTSNYLSWDSNPSRERRVVSKWDALTTRPLLWQTYSLSNKKKLFTDAVTIDNLVTLSWQRDNLCYFFTTNMLCKAR